MYVHEKRSNENRFPTLDFLQEFRNENLLISVKSFRLWNHSGTEANNDVASTVTKRFNKLNSGYAHAI